MLSIFEAFKSSIIEDVLRGRKECELKRNHQDSKKASSPTFHISCSLKHKEDTQRIIFTKEARGGIKASKVS